MSPTGGSRAATSGCHSLRIALPLRRPFAALVKGEANLDGGLGSSVVTASPWSRYSALNSKDRTSGRDP